MGLQQGFQSGLSMGKSLKSGMTDNKVQDAMMRIKNGEDAQAVIKEIAANDPQAAMQIQQILGKQQGMAG